MEFATECGNIISKHPETPVHATLPSQLRISKQHQFVASRRVLGTPTCIMASSVDLAQQLGLEDELALLVLLRLLVGLVVLPADDAQTLLALDVAHQVSPRRHVALAGLALLDVDDRVEEVGLAVLAAEVLLALATDVGPFREDGNEMGNEAERWKAGHGRTLLMMSSWLER